ncbi:GPI transamidase component GPI16 [Thecamonas trahens ATCC 50062]|uniref:GPI transamidase component GPI16 n=1 Tax=Thecamonas trahens ATCC 50062 TaxID=461836 RepID=A0A0L0DQP2_THETB|nr:GPI transamidase component GPI16 [Thecamonas trahens ATCC 50062]KNC54595.1 GPI transamidase component GPI16 [Thecamonas trahens ATCC 50062]|eukprot:XP_013761504.1 GPI transamidase component GPI16 [Thecamonas trahens ATCC 50062]
MADVAGLFCASFELVGADETAVVAVAAQELRRGSLASESVCTENLTPWLKLIPGRSVGLASLIKPLRVFNVKYFAQFVRFRAPGTLVLDLTLVHTPEGLGTGRVMPLANFALPDLLVGREAGPGGMRGSPLADRSMVVLELDAQVADATTLEPAPSQRRATGDGMRVDAVYELESAQNVRVVATVSPPLAPALTPLPSAAGGVSLDRHVSGSGGGPGGMHTCVVNSGRGTVRGKFEDVFPAYIVAYFHTLTWTGDGTLRVLRRQHGRLGSAPHHFELAIEVAGDGELCWSYEFDKEFLHLNKYPPDAHRGFDLASGVLRAVRDGSDETGELVVYTPSVLLHVVTPDFSMPYNVITLTCTVMALFFGSMFNSLLRKPTPAADDQGDDDGAE